MEVMFWVWLGVFVLSLVIEFVTFDLITIWFSAGAIIPFILSAIGGVPLELQIILFVAISALLIVFVRKYAQKWLFKNMNTKTNLDAQTGKYFKLIESIDFEKHGSIKINDIVWTAISEKDEKIDAGEIVEVVRVEGNKMVVKKVESSQPTVEEKDTKTELLKEEKEENK